MRWFNVVVKLASWTFLNLIFWLINMFGSCINRRKVSHYYYPFCDGVLVFSTFYCAKDSFTTYSKNDRRHIRIKRNTLILIFGNVRTIPKHLNVSICY